MAVSLLRHLPSIDALLRRESLQDLTARIGREAVRNRLREVLMQLRNELGSAPSNGLTPESLATEIERRLREDLTRRSKSSTRRVINATGVVIHTNLGRAPLSRAALTAINEVAGGYCNLEFDLVSGQRGKRGAGLEAMLRDLCGGEAAAVVNNCAAAVLIALGLVPLSFMAAGGYACARAWRRKDEAPLMMFPALLLANAAGIAALAARLPVFSAVKASYFLVSLPAFAVLLALGLMLFEERRAMKPAVSAVFSCLFAFSAFQILLIVRALKPG